ncbi:DUF6074 family protein [Chelatococcus sp.]|uniref:DUF6074 family protein n=1 Tax=Chelatococcus sp. TaxID=1953771 RepID=UPI00341E1B3D
MAHVVPFPATSLIGIIRQNVRRATDLPTQAANRSIAQTCRGHINALTAFGIEPRIAAAEGAALEGAIRAELWRSVFERIA